MGIVTQFFTFVIDFFHIGFAAGSKDDLSSDLSQPGKTLFTHPFGQHSHRGTIQQSGVKGSATAVIPGGWPHRFLGFWIEGTAYQKRQQTTVCCSNFVRPGREILTHQAYNPGSHSTDLRRYFKIVRRSKQPRFHVVLPCDSEQIERIQIPQSNLFDPVLQFQRDIVGVHLLRYRRQYDAMRFASGSIFPDDVHVFMRDEFWHFIS